MIGKTLGHYEILGLLGKGGMGEVYRASNPKLDRDVAITDSRSWCPIQSSSCTPSIPLRTGDYPVKPPSPVRVRSGI